MIERIVVTLLPVAFLALLFGSGERFRRRSIDMDGTVPINRTQFLRSKYLIVVLWIAMVLHTWGINLSFWSGPALLKWAALSLWIAGFLLLFAGRLELGSSFRIGQPKERTSLQMTGLFRISRNPMYLGVYATLVATILRTLNPVLLLVAAFIVVVHHRIIIAEERHLNSEFGKEYVVYCSRVGRYL